MTTTKDFKHRLVKTAAEPDEEPQLSHEDFCRLGRVFIEHSNWGRDQQDSRIHEWLKSETKRKKVIAERAAWMPPVEVEGASA